MQVIIFFISIPLNGIVYGMDAPKQPIEHFFVEKGSRQAWSLVPEDIKSVVAAQVLGEKQWWYLDKTFRHNSSVRCVCYSPSGKQIATGSDDCKVRIFDVDEQKELISFDCYYCVKLVCFDPFGEQLVIVTEDGIERIFDIADQRELISFQHNDDVELVCYSPSGKQTATRSETKKIRIVDNVTQQNIAEFAHDRRVLSVCYAPSGRQIATGSEDQKMRIFDIATRKEVALFHYLEWVYSVCYAPSGGQIATASGDGIVRIFGHVQPSWVQLWLKKMLLTWLLIEKPDKKINSPGLLLADIAVKFGINQEEIDIIWQSFPEGLRSAIWRTMQYRIERYGKGRILDSCYLQ